MPKDNLTINLPIYDEAKCVLFALGRNAMYAACRALQITGGDEVLTPAFDCAAAIEPFKALGCSLRFYRLEPYDFSIDLADIREKITPKTRLVHIVNYFGFPQPWNDILAFRQEVNIPILEDNAYSLFSRYDGRHFGTFGDMAIFSLRKTLPLFEGGMLRINNPRYNFINPVGGNGKEYNLRWRYFLGIMANSAKDSLLGGYLRRLLRTINPGRHPPFPLYSDKAGSPCRRLNDKIERIFSCNYLRQISPLAKRQLTGISQDGYQEIIKKKIQCYGLLSEKLKDIRGIEVLWPNLPEGIVPHCLMFLVSSHRDILFETLWKKYDVILWPALPNAVLEQLDCYPEVKLLGRRMLQINLPSEKAGWWRFNRQAENMIKDISLLSRKYIV